MSRFSIGDPVVYVPDHATGPEHKDAERGVVTNVRVAEDPQMYWVDYDDGSGIPKLTYERHLSPIPKKQS